MREQTTLTIQTGLTDELSPGNDRKNSYKTFTFITTPLTTVKTEVGDEGGHGEPHVSEHGGDSTEVTFIILALLGVSWGMILTCRYLELKQEEQSKKKQLESRAPKYKN